MTTGTTETARAAYEAWHTELDHDPDASDPWYLMVRKHLRPERDLAGRRVLEIGCGQGGFACWLANHPQRPREVVAADFAAAALSKARELARRLGVEDIRWEQADIQDMPFGDASFDTVVSCETLEHVPDPGRALRELTRVLRPCGHLFLTTPNYLGLMGLYRAYRHLIGRPYTECGQPINTFTSLLRTSGWVRRNGLMIERTDGDGHYLPFPGRPPIRMRWSDRPRFIMKWFGLHSLVVAYHPPREPA
jgi:2-polyprenyl-3-methyl-5-hydroxy-6-metoxy-1,4-benzoquinol methylase